MSDAVGNIEWVSEFVVRAKLSGELSMAEQAEIGSERLTAEVIALAPEQATIQVYEDTTGLRAGDPVYGMGHPLSVLLGPGLLGRVYDGIQRPLPALKQKTGPSIQRGVAVPALDEERRWQVELRVEQGQQVSPGSLIAVVKETELIEHRILVPVGIRGELTRVTDEGEYTLRDELARVRSEAGDEHSITMFQRWPVRRPRDIAGRLSSNLPLVTGQRIIDTFFPVAKGGAAAIPGGFGTGKTVLQHALAQWSDADVIIYIGCGERGNEMTEVLEEFPELEDPKSGRPLMERTLLIANTSNMPVSARESSIYTGVTIAEYYRDQGYDVAVMADSTSRWAQALREISGRLGEMPIEEGYPAYLPSRLSAFYERAGRVRTLSGGEGSVTLIGAVSPPGGDFSEPVTRQTQRFTRCWWALDRSLAQKRHYPAIDWLKSYSLQIEDIEEWWQQEAEADWKQLRHSAMQLLQEESGLQQLVQLVGPEALSDEQQWTLTGARLLREGFLQQNALSEVDAHATPTKQMALLRLFSRIHERGKELLDEGVSLDRIRKSFEVNKLIRLKDRVGNDQVDQLDSTREEVLAALDELRPKQQAAQSQPGNEAEAAGEES